MTKPDQIEIHLTPKGADLFAQAQALLDSGAAKGFGMALLAAQAHEAHGGAAGSFASEGCALCAQADQEWEARSAGLKAGGL